MNKHGFLLAEETLKLIIAVIAIGFLAYLLFSIYQASKDSNDLDLAKESLEFLTSQISSGKIKVDIYNPDGWWLGAWTKLQKCSNVGLESCICICKEKDSDSCDEDGICLDNSGFLIEGNPIEIKEPPIILSIDQTNKKIEKIGEGTPTETQTEITEAKRSIQELSKIVELASPSILNARCKDYVQYAFDASANYEIPDPLLLFSLMQQESKCNPDADSGSSFGVMQINTAFKRSDNGKFVGYCGDYGLPSDKNECENKLLSDPQMNINVGAQILRDYSKKDSVQYRCGYFKSANQEEFAVDKLYTGLGAALRRYNGVGCAKIIDGREIFADQNYVEDVIDRFNNLAAFKSGSESGGGGAF